MNSFDNRPGMRPAALVAAALALVAVFAFSAYYYVALKSGLFDDSFIYLHIAQNAVEHGTWQYYPGVTDRWALLASSPLRIVVLTIATALAHLAGWGAPTFLDAKITIVISGAVSVLAFLPFWRRNLAWYLLVAAAAVLLSTCLDSVFEFEGGLLYLWLATLLVRGATADDGPSSGRDWLLPLGAFIRPDMALIVYGYVAGRALSERGGFTLLVRRNAVPAVVYVAAWSVVCLMLKVYPIPVTYWAKAALPLLVDQHYLLHYFPERIGEVISSRISAHERVHDLAGWLTLVATALAITTFKRRVSVAGAAIGSLIMLLVLYRLPANFWWYYQNMALMAAAVICAAMVVAHQTNSQIRWGPSLLLLTLLAVAMRGAYPNPGPLLWDMKSPSRAQPYLYLAAHSNGNGTVTLPQLGEVIVKNPEVGIMAYFAAKPYFQWDSAGLAQPADVPSVMNSKLRYFYPRALRAGPLADAQRIADRLGHAVPVMDVWAIGDRDFAAARTKCKYVLQAEALCINPYSVVTPHGQRDVSPGDVR